MMFSIGWGKTVVQGINVAFVKAFFNDDPKGRDITICGQRRVSNNAALELTRNCQAVERPLLSFQVRNIIHPNSKKHINHPRKLVKLVSVISRPGRRLSVDIWRWLPFGVLYVVIWHLSPQGVKSIPVLLTVLWRLHELRRHQHPASPSAFLLLRVSA